jgi:hypothetical protein
MGLLDALKHIGMGAADIVTGGATVPLHAKMAIGDIAGAVGSTGQAAASTAAANRGAQAGQARDLQNDLESQLLARATESRTARNDAANNALRASLLQDWRPLDMPGHIPRFSFANELSGNTRATADELYRQAMLRLEQPDLAKAEGMPAHRPLMSGKKLQSRFQATQSPGWLERLAGLGAFAGPIVQAATGYGRGPRVIDTDETGNTGHQLY